MRNVMRTARQTAGYRERYAMDHGERKVFIDHNHLMIEFTYDSDDPYQDANGATYDATERRWVG